MLARNIGSMPTRGFRAMAFQATDAPSDLRLVQLSRKGDRNAFGELAGRYYRDCLNLARYILQSRSEAEDVVQQAFWKAFEHLDQCVKEAAFFAWLLRIVINECHGLMRIKKRRRFLYLDGQNASEARPLELLSPGVDPEHELVKREMLEVLRTEVGRIPPLFRNVILLRDIERQPMPQVADRLGITVAAAKSRLLRARRELRTRVIRHCAQRDDVV